jgi:Rod binding domain-containing protein
MDALALQSTGLSGAGSVPQPRLERAAREFEAMLIGQLLAPVFNSVRAPEIVGGGGASEKPMAAMLQEEFAKSIAAAGGFGIAEQIKAQLIELQAGR